MHIHNNNMNIMWIVLSFIYLHSLSSEPETTGQVQEAIKKGREDFYNYVDGRYTVKKHCRQEVVNLESDGTQLGVVGGIELESDKFMNMQKIRCRTLVEHFGRNRQVKNTFILVFISNFIYNFQIFIHSSYIFLIIICLSYYV